ncbi:hypothetical protein LTR17_023245 [Elasticomyces elasticus]|nr:hypothetical protein LTR17_023245 [Elasticomyces elasticus]
MSDVYSGAWITLSAAHSDGCNTGLFGPTDRAPPDQTPDNISLGRHVQGNVGPFLADLPNPPGHSILARCPLVYSTAYQYQGQRSDLLITQDWMPASTRRRLMPYVSGGFGRPFDPLEKQPLQTRAWTLQERLLSRRIVHFAADQMYWECNECMSGEDGSQSDPKLYSMEMVIQGQRLSHSDCGHPTDSPGLNLIEGYAPFDQTSRGRWRGGWLKHIENYSGRKLTYESDKVVAVAGLAKQLTTATGDVYFAGLWKNHMIEDLCWRTYPVTEERRQDSGGFAHMYGRRLCTITAQSSYRAPSWSWASLNGDIKFIPVEYTRLVAEVVAAHVEPASVANPFGSASSGWLKIKAPLLPIQRAPPNTEWDKTLPLGFGTLYQVSTPYGMALGEVYFDLVESAVSGGTPDLPSQLSALSIIDTAPNTSKASPYSALFLDSAHCLILKRHTPSHLYERVGLGKFLRTQQQRAGFDLKTYHVGRETPLGPMTAAHARTQVAII